MAKIEIKNDIVTIAHVSGTDEGIIAFKVYCNIYILTYHPQEGAWGFKNIDHATSDFEPVFTSKSFTDCLKRACDQRKVHYFETGQEFGKWLCEN